MTAIDTEILTSTPLITFGAALESLGEYLHEIEDGCLRNDAYEPHSRGKNWVATVTPNRAAPGGMSREFWTHGSGKWYRMPDLRAGDVIEMGGDYVSGRGNKTRDRRYLLVVRIEEGYVVGPFLAAAPTTKSLTAARVTYGVAA